MIEGSVFRELGAEALKGNHGESSSTPWVGLNVCFIMGDARD